MQDTEYKTGGGTYIDGISLCRNGCGVGVVEDRGLQLDAAVV